MKVHGRPQAHELGGRAVTICPLYHPAAALRTPAMLETLREDIARLPQLLDANEAQAEPEREQEPEREPEQLGLSL